MTTQEVANQMVTICRQGKIDEVQATLFAGNAKSIEANDMMGPRVVEGLEAIKAKSAAFQAGVEEFHGATISDPIVAGNSFALTSSGSLTSSLTGFANPFAKLICPSSLKIYSRVNIAAYGCAAYLFIIVVYPV